MSVKMRGWMARGGSPACRSKLFLVRLRKTKGLWHPISSPRLCSCLPGACIDDTILSRQGVENFAKLPSLEAAQGQTVGALALLPSQTSSLLQRGSAHLTALLDQHIRRLQDGETGSPAEATPAQSSGAH